MTQAELDAALAAIPYVGFLGAKAEIAGDVVLARLPFQQKLVGNVHLPALHGGVIGAFMELTALIALRAAEPQRRQPRTIDVTIEYLRSGRPVETFAQAEIFKVGRRVANVRVEAWQGERDKPISALRGHFLVEA